MRDRSDSREKERSQEVMVAQTRYEQHRAEAEREADAATHAGLGLASEASG